MHVLAPVILGLLTKAVFPVLSAIIVGYFVAIARKWSKRLHLETTQADYDFIAKVAQDAASMAEEYAASMFKKYNKKLSPDDTSDIAVKHILSVVPTITREAARRFADIAVAHTPGLGATGNKSV